MQQNKADVAQDMSSYHLEVLRKQRAADRRRMHLNSREGREVNLNTSRDVVNVSNKN